jgi:ribose transport system ATP-binding protein
MQDTMQAPLLQLTNISKSFPGVQALKDVSFAVYEGELHALVGENGAGKSTLMKILAGVYQPDSGEIQWQGKQLKLSRPADAGNVGIRIIYQEFNLLPDLTVAENVFLNCEPITRFGWVDFAAMNQKTKELLGKLETHIHPETLVASLTVAQQQLVEIVKALSENAKLLIMDEPTAALSPTETEHLFKNVRHLSKAGTAVIFISHRLEEVLHLCKTVTVLKDGGLVASQKAQGLSKQDIVRQMVGRNLEDIFPQRSQAKATTPLLEVNQLSTATLHDISFKLYSGEVLGFAGLEGQGQREVVRALFGLEPIKAGEIRLNGQPLRLTQPKKAIDAGIVFISDDRKQEGLALSLNVRENAALPNLRAFSDTGFINQGREVRAVKEKVEAVNVKTPGLEQAVNLLSGGNQQKTVLAKWLLKAPKVMLFAEPTRGIDIGAKVEIYRLIADLAKQGVGIVMVSSELLELLGMSSRILVMRGGHIQAELQGNTTEEQIMLAATGLESVSA